MTKEDVDWQEMAMEEQADAAAIPGHINMNININIDYTPTEDGDYSALETLAKLIGGLK